jgi:hypothetical protein
MKLNTPRQFHQMGDPILGLNLQFHLRRGLFKFHCHASIQNEISRKFKLISLHSLTSPSPARQTCQASNLAFHTPASLLPPPPRPIAATRPSAPAYFIFFHFMLGKIRHYAIICYVRCGISGWDGGRADQRILVGGWRPEDGNASGLVDAFSAANRRSANTNGRRQPSPFQVNEGQ